MAEVWVFVPVTGKRLPGVVMTGVWLAHAVTSTVSWWWAGVSGPR